MTGKRKMENRMDEKSEDSFFHAVFRALSVYLYINCQEHPVRTAAQKNASAGRPEKKGSGHSLSGAGSGVSRIPTVVASWISAAGTS